MKNFKNLKSNSATKNFHYYAPTTHPSGLQLSLSVGSLPLIRVHAREPKVMAPNNNYCRWK